MSIIVDIMTIICITIIFFVFGFNYGWRQCEKSTEKANKLKEENKGN